MRPNACFPGYACPQTKNDDTDGVEAASDLGSERFDDATKRIVLGMARKSVIWGLF